MNPSGGDNVAGERLTIPGGAALKLMVRADRPAGVIRAYFSSLDESSKFEVGTLLITLADDDRALFDAWVNALRDGLARVTAAVTGKTVEGFVELNKDGTPGKRTERPGGPITPGG